MSKSNRHPHLIVQVGLLAALLGSGGGWFLTVLLLVVATRTNSRFFGAAILITLSMMSWYIAAMLFRWQPPKFGLTILVIVLVVCLLIVSSWWSPIGLSSSESRLTSVYRGQKHFNRLSPAWLIDEADQIRLGGILLPFIDPMMSHEQGKRFARVFNSVYAELGHSPEFAQIGSVMEEAYADMLFHAGSKGHAYIYHPSACKNKRCPVIVFFHGWLGNMKAYIWSWAQFADEHGYVIVCPTYLNGVWRNQTAEETIRWLYKIIREDPMCDAEQLFIVGLSNGGTGVTLWATMFPMTFSGLIMVSPIMVDADSAEFASAVGSRPILVVHGGKDNRITPAYVESSVARMKQKGLQVQSICYPEEDHILILSSNERFHSDMLSWINEYIRVKGSKGVKSPIALLKASINSQ